MPAPKILITLLSFAVLVPSVHAQESVPVGDTGPEKVKQVIVYGQDPCPSSGGDEITVCARLAEKERYRIPEGLRTDPNDPKVQSWLNRAQSIEYVGREGTDSCSPVGGGGFTGCFQKMARAAKAERKALMGDVSWSNLVAAEREKRMAGLDAESEDVEKRVKAEEAAEAAKAKAAAPTPTPAN
ncbi:hypothetical protein BH10PSE13_BH10PSE13_16090 [soil metagenome]